MIETFGTMPDGDPVYRLTLAADGLEVKIITYGASLQDLRLEGHAHSLVLGFPELTAYLAHPYFGALVGRVANRIAEAEFSLDGRTYRTDKNENGRQTLHGGKHGLNSKNWKIVKHNDTSVTLAMTDLEAETGFPGDCEIHATYRLLEGKCLELEITAVCDQATVCNIAHHSYFNLDGSGTILDHSLQIYADHYLPVDANQIPTGEIAPVADTGFDFRELRKIDQTGFHDHDHNYCLRPGANALRPIATVAGNTSGIVMEMVSTENGLQVYTGKNLRTSVPGNNGECFAPYHGLALEPQGWPDAPNQPAFPPVRLEAGEQYRQVSRFVFSDS